MTFSSEKFCLKWNDFQQNIVASYHNLREDPDFSDVTLVCEDNHEIEAHRIVLTACSPFFRAVLKRNKHSHPMIYMRGMKPKDLVAIVDFIYYGEANINQEDLDSFLALAEELKLKGLAQAGPEDKIVGNIEDKQEKQVQKHPRSNLKQEHITQPDITKDKDSFTTSTVVNHPMVQVDEIVVDGNSSMDDFKLKLDSMMEKVDDGVYTWKCTVCGKGTKEVARRNMRSHIETHIEGLSYPCSQCDVVSRSRNSLNVHVSRHHRK